MDFILVNIGWIFIGYFAVASVLLVWLLVLLILETKDYYQDRNGK